ncbi:GNAT family N-acetyltransferase [Alicyclobacillus fodiniaquatilis]|jgi:hypothetical protein|uniref:GNAT family N-acetyltransferase n=1 Tax=Alicyclobacillus fodiniaquatilis TaxID=1661150 RepID=A0ABW4JFX4_9BACL
MLSNYELMETHAGVRFKQDEAGRLITGPRIFIGTTRQGIVERYHQNLNEDIANELKHVVQKSPWLDTPNKVNMVEIIQVLNKERPVERVYAGPTYVFHDVRGKHTEAVRITHENIELLKQYFSDWFEDVDVGPVFAVVRDRVAVSLCCSSVQTFGAEASLKTAKDFRGKSYALDVTTAWAAEIQNQGRTALYSTAWNNLSSQAVARKLELKQYGVELEFW